MTPSQRLEPLLQRFWGYREFRPHQREIAEAILGGRDSLLVLPTGGGKSLAYQLPILALGEGLAVVVSPLISLMKDQVDGLVGQGVPAAAFNSSQTHEERDRVRRELREGRLRLLYVSPERLVGESGADFCRLLEGCDLRYLAIDEAHCISQWGHDFRPDYRQLGRLRETFPGISLHAFTATATPRVRDDIGEQLGLRDPLVRVGSYDRPNLVYRALHRSDLFGQLRAVLRRHEGEAGIVYCLSRKRVEKVAERLQRDGIRAVPYHAGLGDEVRHRNQEDFLQERVDVVVATVAFGMGIDRSDVRFVVHAEAPRSLEHYQQEAGRAGRDGLEAECVLLHGAGDFVTWRRLLAASGELTPAAKTQLRDLEGYANQTRCRHRALCAYFGEELETESCGACDWCLGELEEVADALVVAQKILSCVLRLRESWGLGRVIDVLRAREDPKLMEQGHHLLSTWGLLGDHPVPELRGFADQLIAQGFLAQEGDRYPTLRVPPEGRRLLKGEVECVLFRHRRPAKKDRRRARPAQEGWDGVDVELFERLRELRLAIARERKVPPYVIFHDRALREIARHRPTSQEELLEIHGVGERKAADLGPLVLEEIARPPS